MNSTPRHSSFKTLIKIASIASTFILVALGLTLFFAPPAIEKGRNQVNSHPPYTIDKASQYLHNQLVIADLHSDSLLWDRDLTQHTNSGHVDLPRLQEGNVATQVFSAVTKSPQGQNVNRNSSTARDTITLLAMIQAWPPRTWHSLYQRALYQADKLARIEKQQPEQLKIIKNRQDLATALTARKKGNPLIGASGHRRRSRPGRQAG